MAAELNPGAMEDAPDKGLLDPRRIRFDRNEFSGAFGDIGTDFPLIVGMIIAAQLDPASTLIAFGLMQLLTGFFYGIPMPAQPLKAMAVIVITQKISGSVLFGGGLAVGVIMLLLAVTGATEWLARIVPRPVVRGIQFGLGLQLATLALRDYLPSEGQAGWLLGAAAFIIILLLIGNRKFPPAPLVIGLGLAYAIAFRLDLQTLASGVGVRLPALHIPQWNDVWLGFLLLALPQIPLSLGNSILASKQVAHDLFPEKKITIKKISLTYSLMNLINPFIGGVPTCHGSGGMVGHYAFGGRTGGSVIIYGLVYLTLGLFFSGSFGQTVLLFPKPMLGIILFFEAVALIKLVRDQTFAASDFALVVLVGLIAVFLPYGYLWALALGTVLFWYFPQRLRGMAGEEQLPKP